MYRVAVKKANQTIVVADGRSTRHIPRDVRQRVWQRYGGQCAECGATDYLEFDHVIPVARGGSNAEANVQLLCRRCNGKKSDMI
jgi:5-methylcytosine-specific restriction endonuclease McrA